MMPYLRFGNLIKHTLLSGTYLYSPYMGEPPPPLGPKHYSLKQIHVFVVSAKIDDLRSAIVNLEEVSFVF